MVQIMTGICTPIVASNARTPLARTGPGVFKGVSSELILLRWCFKAYCYASQSCEKHLIAMVL